MKYTITALERKTNFIICHTFYNVTEMHASLNTGWFQSWCFPFTCE